MNLFKTTAMGTSLALLALASPALAEGKTDRARAAIAEAQGKVDIAVRLNAGGEVPRLQAEAQSALRTAKDDLAGSHKEQAIADALRASQLADRAVGEAQRMRVANDQARRDNAAVAVGDAQAAAADANARAADAERAAAAAQAEAAAARAAPPVVVAPPAPTTTTVTTETTKTAAVAARTTVRRPAKRVVHKTVHRAAVKPAVSAKTTTTVTTTQN